MPHNAPTPPPGSLRAIEEKTPANGTRFPPLHKLPTDPGERRKLHDAAAARAQTPDQRWEHTQHWLGINTEETAATKRIALSSADYMVEMKADLLLAVAKLSRQDTLHDAADADQEKARKEMAEKIAKHERLLMAKGAAALGGGALGLVGVIKGVLEALPLVERFLK